MRPRRRPCGVRRLSALSMRRCRRNSAREVIHAIGFVRSLGDQIVDEDAGVEPRCDRA